MKKRLISTVALIAIVSLGTIYLNPIFFAIGLWLLLMAGLYEFWGMTLEDTHWPALAVVAVGGGCLLLSEGIVAAFIVWLVGLALFLVYMFNRRPVHGSSRLLMGQYFSFLYLFASGYCWTGLRYAADGAFWILWSILVVKVGDIAAYLVGRKWGVKKLAPLVSPQKTWLGALASVLASVGLGYLSFKQWGPSALSSSSGEMIVFLVLLNIAGQLGDLLESLFKRDSARKDSGQILPGIGGSLDLLDSLLLALPMVYFYLSFKRWIV